MENDENLETYVEICIVSRAEQDGSNPFLEKFLREKKEHEADMRQSRMRQEQLEFYRKRTRSAAEMQSVRQEKREKYEPPKYKFTMECM